jgi:hypothetical protein
VVASPVTSLAVQRVIVTIRARRLEPASVDRVGSGAC